MKEVENLGLTRQRTVVLDVIRDAKTHLTANEVFDDARRRLPGISFATVYNSLRFLKDEGLIGEVRIGTDAARYDRKLTRHDHAFCTSCGKLVDLDLPPPKALMKKAAALSDFELGSVEVIFRGRCPDCSHTKTKRS